MQNFAIIKKIDENSNCPAAHLVGCRQTFGRRGVVEYFDTLEDANRELFAIAQRSEDSDDSSNPAIWTARTWSLFCANVARLGTCNLRASTDGDGCRNYHDSDVEAFQVVPVVLTDDGDDIDARETAYQM